MKYTEEFDTFWVKYPARWSVSLGTHVKRKKRPAFEKWQKLSQEIRSECLAKVHLIKKHEGDAKSVRDCVTWLNQAGWEDIQLEKPKPFVTKQYANSMFQPVCGEIDDKEINDRRNEQRKGLRL